MVFLSYDSQKRSLFLLLQANGGSRVPDEDTVMYRIYV